MRQWKILVHDDFDGLVSSVLLSIKLKTNIVEFYEHDKKYRVNKNTVIADLPYQKGAGMWFDHHITSKINKKFKGRFSLDKSCATTIYNHFNKKFPRYYKSIIKKANKSDSGSYTTADIKNYNKVYLLDRIGFLAPFNNSKEKLLFFKIMFNHFKNERPFNDLFKNEYIKKLVKRIKNEDKKSLAFVRKNGIIKNKTLVINSSNKNITLNPFYIYVRYPKCKYVMIISRKKSKLGILLTFNKFYNTKHTSNIGGILKRYGGDGHKVIGGCRINKKYKEKVLNEILKKLK